MKQFTNQFFRFLVILTLIITFSVSWTKAEHPISIYKDTDDQKVLFAFEKLKSELSKQGYSVRRTGLEEADIAMFSVSSAIPMKKLKESVQNYNFQLKPEGFSILVDKKSKIWLVGGDYAGVMYGELELAEQIKLFGINGIQSSNQNPYMEKRGIKFNIPLDVRTPSYTDMSDAGQNNIVEMWNFGFWKELIDNLAANRYNLISIWSLHPFPSMIKVPEYPEIALDEVKRSTTKFAEYYSTRATGYDTPDIIENTEILLKI